MIQEKHASAVEELLSFSDVKDYSATLEEFWEAWLTHENSECLNAKERAAYLHMYKRMRFFLNSIS